MLRVYVRFANNKAPDIYEYIEENDADLVAISESWLNDGNTAVIKEISPDGYELKGKQHLCHPNLLSK